MRQIAGLYRGSQNEMRAAQGGMLSGPQRRAVAVCARSFLLAGMIVVPAFAHGQSTMPDAQIEANVLKALAGSADLAGQNILTNTVYGVVTLSGTVPTDDERTKADNLAANADGVKKVIDRLQVGAAAQTDASQFPASQPAAGQATANQPASDQNAGPGPGMVLQSDGTYAPAPAAGQAQRNDPDNDQALDLQTEQQQAGANAQGANGQGAAGQGMPGQTGSQQGGQQQAPPAYGGNNGYPPASGYPQNGNQNGYPNGNQNRNPNYAQNGYPPQPRYAAPWGGQVAGETVSIPAGTLVRVRVNRLIASDKAKPGDHFDGLIANDVVAGGLVAIPRGAAVQGTVVDAKGSGAIHGRGELSIELNSVTLGGRIYPIASDVWAHNGADKTIQTVNSAAGFGVVGALIGAVAGRGTGAAIGAGVGAAAGVGASAASPRGQVIIPPEGMVSFNLAQPAQVTTVSEQEIQRLAYGAGPGRYPYETPPRRPLYGYPGYPPPPPPYGYPSY